MGFCLCDLEKLIPQADIIINLHISRHARRRPQAAGKKAFCKAIEAVFDIVYNRKQSFSRTPALRGGGSGWSDDAGLSEPKPCRSGPAKMLPVDVMEGLFRAIKARRAGEG